MGNSQSSTSRSPSTVPRRRLNHLHCRLPQPPDALRLGSTSICANLSSLFAHPRRTRSSALEYWTCQKHGARRRVVFHFFSPPSHPPHPALHVQRPRYAVSPKYHNLFIQFTVSSQLRSTSRLARRMSFSLRFVQHGSKEMLCNPLTAFSTSSCF